MAIRRLDHVGIVVDDLDAAIEFFVALGLQLEGRMQVDGPPVDSVIGLEGVHSEIAMLQPPDGSGGIELSRFSSPPSLEGDRWAPANTRGLRHVAFPVDDVDAAVAAALAHGGELVGEVVRYEASWRLCYVRGPEGVLVELAERLG